VAHHDLKALRAAVDAIAITRPKPSRRRLQHLCLDEGCDYPFVDDAVADCGYVGHISRRGTTPRKKKRGERARLWVVERTHSWINRSRRLLVRWKKKVENYEATSHSIFMEIIIAFLGAVILLAILRLVGVGKRGRMFR
jgi:putative transposase